MARKRNVRPGVTTHLDLAKIINEILDEPPDCHGEPKLGYKVLRAIIQAMTKALQAGEPVIVRGFGKFHVVERTPKRTGSNFVANKPNVYSPVPLTYTPRKYVVFTPSIQTRAMVNIDSPNAHERDIIAQWDLTTDDHQ